MEKLETRLNALKLVCSKLEIENLNYHRVYVITMYQDRICIQGHHSASLTSLIKDNFDTSDLSINESGFVVINVTFENEKFEITLT
jgi:hypothetical protein